MEKQQDLKEDEEEAIARADTQLISDAANSIDAEDSLEVDQDHSGRDPSFNEGHFLSHNLLTSASTPICPSSAMKRLLQLSHDSSEDNRTPPKKIRKETSEPPLQEVDLEDSLVRSQDSWKSHSGREKQQPADIHAKTPSSFSTEDNGAAAASSYDSHQGHVYRTGQSSERLLDARRSPTREQLVHMIDNLNRRIAAIQKDRDREEVACPPLRQIEHSEGGGATRKQSYLVNAICLVEFKDEKAAYVRCINVCEDTHWIPAASNFTGASAQLTNGAGVHGSFGTSSDADHSSLTTGSGASVPGPFDPPPAHLTRLLNTHDSLTSSSSSGGVPHVFASHHPPPHTKTRTPNSASVSSLRLACPRCEYAFSATAAAAELQRDCRLSVATPPVLSISRGGDSDRSNSALLRDISNFATPPTAIKMTMIEEQSSENSELTASKRSWAELRRTRSQDRNRIDSPAPKSTKTAVFAKRGDGHFHPGHIAGKLLNDKDENNLHRNNDEHYDVVFCSGEIGERLSSNSVIDAQLIRSGMSVTVRPTPKTGDNSDYLQVEIIRVDQTPTGDFMYTVKIGLETKTCPFANIVVPMSTLEELQVKRVIDFDNSNNSTDNFRVGSRPTSLSISLKKSCGQVSSAGRNSNLNDIASFLATTRTTLERYDAAGILKLSTIKDMIEIASGSPKEMTANEPTTSWGDRGIGSSYLCLDTSSMSTDSDAESYCFPPSLDDPAIVSPFLDLELSCMCPLLATGKRDRLASADSDAENAGSLGKGLLELKNKSSVPLPEGKMLRAQGELIEKGPIPEPGSQLFAKCAFIFSQCRNHIKVRKVLASSESESDMDLKSPSSCSMDVNRLTRQVVAGGGQVFKRLCEVPRDLKNSLYLISDRPSRSPLYLACILEGIPLVSYSAIVATCIDKQNFAELVKISAEIFQLPIGWSDETGHSIYRTQKHQPLLDKNVTIIRDVSITNQATYNYWREILKRMGANVSDRDQLLPDESAHFVILDGSKTTTHAQNRAFVNYNWLVHTLMHGNARSPDASPYYSVTYTAVSDNGDSSA